MQPLQDRLSVYLISKLSYLVVPQVMEAPLADGVDDEGQLVVSLLPQLAHLPIAYFRTKKLSL